MAGVFGWTGWRAARTSARMSAVLGLIAAWLIGAPAWAASVETVEVTDDRIAIRFDGAVADASTFLLEGPLRIAVDVAGADPGGRAETDGAVTKVRQGRQGADGSRIVFDLSRPVVVARSAFSADARMLTLELRDADPRSFGRAVAGGRQRIGAPGTKVTMDVPAPKRRLALPAVKGTDGRPLVVIDAGHGGHDPGALGPDGLREKDVTLALARAVRDELLRSGRVRVALTRESDRFLVLQERYGIARKLGADLFISLHCDAAGSPQATGASVYTLSEVASDKEAARLAARENKADIIAGVDLGDAPADISSILIDLTQRETMNRSAEFARLLGREAKPLMPFKPQFHRMASLLVLKAPDLPSILFETGYISNPNDAAFLASREGQKKVAEGVRRAVDVHFARQLASR